jgi:hypothetical protein
MHDAMAHIVITRCKWGETRGVGVGKTETKRKHQSGSKDAERKAARAQMIPHGVAA